MHTPLEISNTPNCLPHPWHPSVVYVAEGWNGHRWWMAQAPFPPRSTPPFCNPKELPFEASYCDRYELPCIHYSDDGRHWCPIPTNPIDDLDKADEEAHNYLSDPHLVLRNGELECYYRRTLLTDRQLQGNKTQLLRKRSTDGVHWSEREVLADLRTEADQTIWGEQIISPAVHWDGTLYRCWYVDRSSYLDHRQILLTTSPDGLTWLPYQVLHIDMPEGIDPWHLDVQHYDDRYQMLLYDRWHLHWLESPDGIHFRYVSHVLSPTQYFADFYSNGLYRACSVKVNRDILIFFSAKNPQRTSIGLLRTTDRKHFTPVNGITPLHYLHRYLLPQASWHNAKRFIKHTLKPIKRLIKRL